MVEAEHEEIKHAVRSTPITLSLAASASLPAASASLPASSTPLKHIFTPNDMFGVSSAGF